MITIALDEGGHFEQLGNNSKCMFVGGVVFGYKDKNDCKAELTRLKKFFKEICKKEKCTYPEDLHYNRVNGTVINGGRANRVKTSIIHSLPDFLNGKGNWQNDGPHGKYYLYALVGDRNGVEEFTKSGISNLIDDEVGCNRYEHMAYRSIENLLFFNPQLNDNLVRLDLATRVVAANNDDDFEKEVRATGHEKSKEDVYQSVYKVTNASSFRAAIATMIQNSSKKNIQFDDVRVESIYYHQNPTHNLFQGFLYLSDIVCSLYDDILNGCNKANVAIEKLWLESKQYVPNNRFYGWTYNDFDQTYRELYKAFESKDFYNALKLMYDLSKVNEKNSEVYEALFFDKIKKNIIFDSNLNELSVAIEHLDSELANSEIKVSEARFIYDLLKPRTEELCENRNQQVLFHLYKAELAINNHEGNHEESKNSFEKCKTYSQYVNVEEYLELRNMYSVCLCDANLFDEAVELTEETLEWEKMLIDVKKAVFPEKNNINIHYGRTLSQLGQCYSFKGNFDAAIERFNLAIESFGNATIEISRTRSYLLHALIEAGQLQEYEKVAAEYFGYTNQKEQLISLLDKIQEDAIPYSFALYVYLKAFYIFYSKNIEKKYLKEIIQKFDSLKKLNKKDIENHPFEMIYKYIAFLCLSIENKEFNDKAKEYIDLAKTTLSKPEGILVKILDEIDIQYESVLNKQDAFEKSKLGYMYR